MDTFLIIKGMWFNQTRMDTNKLLKSVAITLTHVKRDPTKKVSSYTVPSNYNPSVDK